MTQDRPSDRLTRDLRKIFGVEGVEIPPPVVRAMEAEIREWEPGRRVVMEFPTLKQDAGPTGFVQGGVLAAAFDNAFGPVAYSAAGGLVVSVGLSVTFLRPLPVTAGRFTVEAELVDATRRFTFVRGTARAPHDRILATCTSELVAVDPKG